MGGGHKRHSPPAKILPIAQRQAASGDRGPGLASGDSNIGKDVLGREEGYRTGGFAAQWELFWAQRLTNQ